MILMSSSFILVKGVFVITLAEIGPNVVGFYLMTEMLLFLVLKIIRGDLVYWIPVNGLMGWFIAIFLRVTCKIIVDFTGEAQ